MLNPTSRPMALIAPMIPLRPRVLLPPVQIFTPTSVPVEDRYYLPAAIPSASVTLGDATSTSIGLYSLLAVIFGLAIGFFGMKHFRP